MHFPCQRIGKAVEDSKVHLSHLLSLLHSHTLTSILIISITFVSLGEVICVFKDFFSIRDKKHSRNQYYVESGLISSIITKTNVVWCLPFFCSLNNSLARLLLLLKFMCWLSILRWYIDWHIFWPLFHTRNSDVSAEQSVISEALGRR